MMTAHPIRWLVALTALAAGCAGTIAPTASSAAVAPTETQPEPSATEATPHPSWNELRDAVFGYGIALPCWWTVIPTPGQGVIATMTIQSYDEAYFIANSTRGVWVDGDYPEGAFKMDWTGVTQVDAALTTQAALQPLLENDTQEIVSAEEVQVGRQSAILYQLRSRFNPDETARLHAFRLAPGTVLMASVYPDRALSAPEILGILNSLALTPEETIELPTSPPSQPLIAVPDGCVAP